MLQKHPALTVLSRFQTSRESKLSLKQPQLVQYSAEHPCCERQRTRGATPSELQPKRWTSVLLAHLPLSVVRLMTAMGRVLDPAALESARKHSFNTLFICRP